MLKFLRSIFVNSFKLNVPIIKTGNKLEADLEFYKIKMPKSRKAKYYLGCYDGSVFIDLNKSSDCIYLKRISFDGFGCYEIYGEQNLLSKK